MDKTTNRSSQFQRLFSEFIKENEEYIVPRNIVTWTFNKMDITNTEYFIKTS